MERARGWKAWGLVALLLASLPATDAWGLTDEEIFRDFRFNFINPGARALGLGGAFIAAADDATAAEANPAALHYVSKYEVFLEYRDVSTEGTIARGVFGDNSVTSDQAFADFTSITIPEDQEFLSFASFAVPFRIKNRRARFAVSRQTVLNTENFLSDGTRPTSLDVSLADFPIVVVVDPNTGAPSVERYSVRNTVDGFLEAELVNYNLGFSIELTQDFSLGLTATMADLDMSSEVTSETDDPRGLLTSIHPRLSLGSGLSDIRTRTLIDDSDSDLTYTVGLHWHPDSVFPSGYSPIRFGLVWRSGAELGVEEVLSEFNPTSGAFEEFDRFENVLRVPDRWGIGSSYEVGNNWLFALDVERIQYSDLLEGFRTGVNFFTSGRIPDTLLPIDPNELVFDVDDATIVHAGIEFNVTSRSDWNSAVRVGYFNAEDNKIRLETIDTGDPQIDDIFRDLFGGGTSEDHFTVGFSIGTPVGIQVQFAADISDEGEEYVASAIYRFGRIR